MGSALKSLKFPQPKQQEEDLKFGVKLLKIVISKSSELHNEIKGKTPNWDPERIAFIDKVILRTAIAELLHFEDIPAKVTFVICSKSTVVKFELQEVAHIQELAPRQLPLQSYPGLG